MSTSQPLATDRERIRSVVGLNIAVLLFGGTSLFAKIILLPVPAVIFGRSVIAALAILIYVLATGGTLRLATRRDVALQLVTGLLMAVHWVTYFQAVRVSTVAVGTISLHTYPIITVLLEPLVDRKRLRLSDVLLAVAVLAGVVILVPDFSLASATSQGVLWGIGSAMLITVRNLFVRRIIRSYPGPVIMFYHTAITAIVLLPFAAANPGLGPIVGEWPWFLLLGTVFTALNQTLYAASLQHLSAKTVSIIATLLPLYSTTLALLLLGEVPTARTVIGGIVVVAAVMTETVRATRRRGG